MRAAALLSLLVVGVVALLWIRSTPGGRAAELPAIEASARAAEPRAAALAGSDRAPEPLPEATEAPSPVADSPAPTSSASQRPTDALVGCVLHGRVSSSDGSPFRGWKPWVSATDAAGARRQTEVTEQGHYSLAGLAPGRWTLTCSGTGFQLVTEEIELDRAEPIARRDFVLVRATVLAVRVRTPGGEDLARALQARRKANLPTPELPFPVATREKPAATIPEAARAGNDDIGVGSFWGHGPLFDATPPGTLGVLVLSVDPPVYVSLCSGERVLATQAVPPGQGEVVFVIEPETLLERQASVRVRFVAEDTGEPLKGSLGVDGSTMWNVQDVTWSQTMLPGKHVLTFWTPGYARIPLEITLEPGQELDLGEQRIPRELTISGRLLDADGKPVLGRLVLGTCDAAGRLSFDDDWMYESDASGAYTIHGLVRGRYVLRTLGDDQVRFPARDEPPTEWVSGNVEVSTLGGSATGLDLSLVRAGILVLQGAATLPEGSRCKVLDERGDLLRTSAFHPGFVPRFALPPGPCTFVLCDADWNEVRRYPLTIVAGVTELDLGR